MMKTLIETEIEGIFFNVIKRIYKKPTAHIILDSEGLHGFPLDWERGMFAHQNGYSPKV